MLSPCRPVAFHIMAKPHGSVCNLHCTYCYYLEKKWLYAGEADMKMNDAWLETFTRQYIESQDTSEVTFTWQGGEPTLMGIGFYRKALALQQKYRNGKSIHNTLQTNGMLLNDEWGRFLHDHHILTGISIDGPREIHDAHRVSVVGKPSFDRVMEGIRLLKKHHVEFNTLSVVHRENAAYPLEIYHFLKSVGSGFIQFIPIVERCNRSAGETDLKLVTPDVHKDASVTEWSVRPEEYGTFLIRVFDEWVRQDVGRTFVQLFDVTLANWVGQTGSLCVFSETCGDAMVLEHNGDLYSCDHYVYPEYRLGNLQSANLVEMARSVRQLAFGNEKLTKLPAFCLQCDYRFACHGECPKHRFDVAPDGQQGLNYLCKAYKMFFSHVHPYMQYMAIELVNGRAPANVMPWAQRL